MCVDECYIHISTGYFCKSSTINGDLRTIFGLLVGSPEINRRYWEDLYKIVGIKEINRKDRTIAGDRTI